MTAINKDKIIKAYITHPYTNSGEHWDMTATRGWGVVLVMESNTAEIVNKESEEECKSFIESLGFIITEL